MTNFDYYDYRIKNVTQVINREIAFLESIPYHGVYPFNSYLAYLKKRIGTEIWNSKTFRCNIKIKVAVNMR